MAVRGGRIDQQPQTVTDSGVRRLTPTECERIQGFPDNYTLIDGGKRRPVEDDMRAYLRRARPDIAPEAIDRLAADGPRYRSLGNSMSIDVMAWIGRRLVRHLANAAN